MARHLGGIGMNNTFIRAQIPPELIQEWLQYVRDFDTKHPGCHFEVCADMPDMPIRQMVDILKVNPELKFVDVFERQGVTPVTQLKQTDLEEIWTNYERWEKEGQPPYGQYATNAKGQYYYDHYHDHISPAEGKKNTYEFSIQVYDSPEGDTWIVGEFVRENGKIQIIEQHAEER